MTEQQTAARERELIEADLREIVDVLAGEDGRYRDDRIDIFVGPVGDVPLLYAVEVVSPRAGADAVPVNERSRDAEPVCHRPGYWRAYLKHLTVLAGRRREALRLWDRNDPDAGPFDKLRDESVFLPGYGRDGR